MTKSTLAFCVLLLGLVVQSCTPFTADPVPGQDKQAVGTWYGAAVGAGTGAVTGAQVAAATGPGAWIGAGFGAIFGLFSGIGQDMVEDDQMRRLEEQQMLKEKLWVQEVLAEHYDRRAELHPGRDIFPADWFFDGDSNELSAGGELLLREVAGLSKNRMPWSRLVVAVYAVSSDPKSSYSDHLTKRRAEEISLRLSRGGIEPRRIVAQSAVLKEPIVLDPYDSPNRYAQAVEIIALDR